MTREEEIRKASQEFAHSIASIRPELNADSFRKGAKWADETMIDKAKKWLENFLEKAIQKPSINDGFTSDTIRCADYKRSKIIKDFLYDFKKAMEE